MRRTSYTVLVNVFQAALVCLLFAVPAWADAYHVILSGSGGEAVYRAQFHDWTTRLRDVLVQELGHAPERVYAHLEAPADQGDAFRPVTLEAIQQRFQGLSEIVTDADEVYVYLIGHGSYINAKSNFHIPGPDLTAIELGRLLDGLHARRIVVLNGASGGAGFINVLSAPNRVVCSATKSVSEINATEFMGHFIAGLEEGSADMDHDGRISFLEACEQAAELTATWYLGESLLSTEHAILDDNADGLGSRLPLSDVDAPDRGVFDGSLASQCFLKDFQFPPEVPQDMIDTYLDAIDRVYELRRKKASMDAEAYYEALVELLIRAAQANREIRRLTES
ncbi:MAG: hypothetical protein IIB38_10925 [Candidatus Hydrogenedentes bacterium]|nr:hypothetical protein [Candidatus Hydrogenedentota bacterium]